MEFLKAKQSSEALRWFEKRQNIGGAFAPSLHFIEQEQVKDRALWAKFVDQFRLQPDSPTLAWRGEYWGKMMRGAVSIYVYSGSDELYSVLEETVRDLISVQDADGRVSSYSRDAEFCGWDLWCRKYVMLGMMYFYDICKSDKLRLDILEFLKGHADYILAHIGEGKLDITRASSSWFGINSSSILEPMVWLFRYTGEKRYLDFSEYIIKRGGADRVNIFELAHKNEVLPYQYGVAKAYELTSCFEGLAAYYEVTGEEKYKTAAINYGYAILDSEQSVIGSLGTTHELLDHTVLSQTSQRGKRAQETCVTVTWMKYCATMYRLTADVRFADAIEKSFYNAYLGSINTERRESPYMRYVKFKDRPEREILKDSFMPFDSYSPMTPGVRGLAVGGNQLLSDGSYYGCCACIGSMGLGVYASHRLLYADNALVLSFFDNGDETAEINGVPVTVSVSGDYPRCDEIKIKVSAQKCTSFKLKVRIPGWSQETLIKSEREYSLAGGFAEFSGNWGECEEITLKFDMRIRALLPLSWEEDEVYTDMTGSANGYFFANVNKVYHLPEYDDYIALTRGPITLAADSRLGKAADSVFSFKNEGGIISARELEPGDAIERLEFTSEEGERFTLIDYASAGKDWATTIAAWLPTK